MLVAGHPGAGKTTLAAQFIYAGLKNEEPGLYISLSERKDDFIRHMKKLGIDFETYEEKGGVQVSMATLDWRREEDCKHDHKKQWGNTSISA